jgi:hypothetical protein
MGPVLINGVNYSWSSLNNLAFGIPVTGITEIEWSREQDKENNYGAGQEPISRGYSNIKYSGSITCYKDFWAAVCNAAPGKDPLRIAPFNWTLLFGDSNTQFFTEVLKNFEFLKDTSKASQGETKLLVQIPFIWAGLDRQ